MKLPPTSLYVLPAGSPRRTVHIGAHSTSEAPTPPLGKLRCTRTWDGRVDLWLRVGADNLGIDVAVGRDRIRLPLPVKEAMAARPPCFDRLIGDRHDAV